MTDDLPLGRREDARLEFKAADALRDPSKIGREVVAMLNAEGGTVWVGIEEEEGRAVRITEIRDADLARRRLHDYLIDAIEPSPLNDEVDLDTVGAAADGTVLRIRVDPAPDRRPYALLRGGNRMFLIRVGDRNRPMSRGEIATEFRAPARRASLREDDELDSAMKDMLEARRRVQERGDQLFWLRLRPMRAINVDLRDQNVDLALRSPKHTGNRPAGWTFVNPYRDLDRRTPNRLSFGSGEINRDGTLTFEIPLESLYWKGNANEIYPFALMEYPVSAFRIAKVMYGQYLDATDRIVADFALFSLKGWVLRPHSPKVMGYVTRDCRPFDESNDLVSEGPLVFRFEEVSQEPDWCAFRLAIRRTYEAFGYYEDEIPAEFDLNARRLIIES